MIQIVVPMARSDASGWVLSRDAATIKVEDVYRLFVFHTDARVPARHASSELESLAHEISTRVGSHMQTSLEALFNQTESNAEAGGAVVPIKTA